MANILAIHAHPDDVEILAGGTMALLADLGHQITIATFTPGDCGSKELGAVEIAAVRRKEAASAAALIGARYFAWRCGTWRFSTTTGRGGGSRRRCGNASGAGVDGVAGGLPLRPRSGRRAGARCLLRGAGAELRHANGGSGGAAGEDSASVLHGSGGGERIATAGWSRRTSWWMWRRLSHGSARCWRNMPASETGCGNITVRTIIWKLWNVGRANAGRWRAWRSARASVTTRATRTRRVACWRNCWARR